MLCLGHYNYICNEILTKNKNRKRCNSCAEYRKKENAKETYKIKAAAKKNERVEPIKCLGYRNYICEIMISPETNINHKRIRCVFCAKEHHKIIMKKKHLEHICESINKNKINNDLKKYEKLVLENCFIEI